MKKYIILIAMLTLLVACKKPPVVPVGIADMSGYGIKSEQFLIMSLEDSYELLTTGKGFIYYGFENCPWCKELIPILDVVAKEKNMEIYYVDVRPDGDEIRSFENEAYGKIVDFTKEYLDLNEKGEFWLYVPQLFAFNNGKIVASHKGTLPNHNAPERSMTEAERDLLKEILIEFYSSVK